MDDDLCIIFGSIPKAGSSTIRIWLKSIGGTHNADAAQRLGRGKIVQKQLGYSGVLPDSLRKECFTFTFLRDPVDRYVSGLYESHRKSDGPSAVNVPELTYAFVSTGIQRASGWIRSRIQFSTSASLITCARGNPIRQLPPGTLLEGWTISKRIGCKCTALFTQSLVGIRGTRL